MTEQEQRAVEQRTRLLDAADIIAGVANDADTVEAHAAILRSMRRDLMTVAMSVMNGVKVRKERTPKAGAE